MEVTLDLHVRTYGRNSLKSQVFHLEEVHEALQPVDTTIQLKDYHLDLHLTGPCHGFPKGEIK